MGSLNIFDIISFKKKYDLNCFIETGTGIGNSLKYVLESTKNNKFDSYFSIEISTPLWENCLPIINHYPSQKINIINSNSVEGLEKILSCIKDTDKVFFWLDAHFPNADYMNSSYTDEKNKKIRIPLEEEIQTIYRIRKGKKDLFIIDDLRIYEDGNFEGGNWSLRNQYGGNGIDFIEKCFSETHDIIKNYRHEGYVILLPR